LGLSGLSVGLGAWMPNFQERDPSKIAVGFGGTLNLVAGLVYLLLVIGLLAMPWHGYSALQESPDPGLTATLLMLGWCVVAGGVLAPRAGPGALPHRRP